MKKIKVLVVLDSLNIGGTEILNLDICKNANYLNRIEFFFLAINGGILEEEYENSEVKFQKIYRKFPIDFNTLKRIRKIVKREKIDFIQCNRAVDGLHGYLATIGLKIKRILFFHGYCDSFKDNWVLKFLISKMDINISVSKALIKLLKVKNNSNIYNNFTVLYNGVDYKRIRAIKKIKANDDQNNKFIIGMVGNFVEAKDQLTVCKSIPYLLNDIPNLEVHFIGGPDSKNPFIFEQCKNFCNENNLSKYVNFAGHQKDVPSYLAQLDAFVFSTKSDSFGLVVIEAMLNKIPTIISDIDSMKEISSNGEYSLLFKVGDQKDLSEKILLVSKNKGFSNNLKEKAFVWAKENFSIETYLSNLEKIYLENK